MMVCVGFQDTTAIPLVYASVLGENHVTSPDSDFKSEALEYVLIYTVFIIVYKWTVAYGLMETELMHSSSVELVEDVEDSTLDPEEKGLFWKIKKIMNPPIYATLAAIPLALIPGINKYIIAGSGAVFRKNLFEAANIVGQTASPIIDIILGCNLSEGYPPTADIKWKHINLILLGKLFLMPAVGLVLVGGFYIAGIINRVMAVMVMIIYAGPTSLQMLMICTAHKNQVENVSKVYLVMYLFAAVPMSGWTIAILLMFYG